MVRGLGFVYRWMRLLVFWELFLGGDLGGGFYVRIFGC